MDELNAWVGERCKALWVEVRHPEHKQFSVAEVLEQERLQMMPMPVPFDGYVEEAARVSSTCLATVARNRYSVPCELAGQMLQNFFQSFFTALITSIGSDRIPLRMTLCASQLVGMGMIRYVAKFEPLASTEIETLVAAVAPNVQRYLTGEIG